MCKKQADFGLFLYKLRAILAFLKKCPQTQLKLNVETLINEIKKDSGLIEFDVAVPGAENNQLRSNAYKTTWFLGDNYKYFDDVWGYASKTPVTASN